jgi:ankyrin repeat protein
MIARPTEASIARMMAASEVGAGFFDMIFEMQDDLANAEVVRLLGEHLKFYDLDGLYLNRTLGCPSWVRDLHAELVTENGDLLLDFDDYRLENLFHAAAQANAVDIVQQCIHAGVDINCSDEEPAMGGMAVFHASERNCVAVVSLLCNCADIDADAALIAAAECGLEAEVKSLLERGANINIFDRRVRGVWPLSGAVTQGHAAIVRLLASRPECLLEDPENPGPEGGKWSQNSPLVRACENGRPDVVSLLLAHRHGGRLSVDCGALSMAIVSNNADCAQLLLDAGACINSPAPRQYIYARTVVRTNVFDQEEPGDRDRYSTLPPSIGPLALACVLGRTEIAAELLRRGANCNAVDFAGRTALMGACYEGRDDILRLLLGAAGVGAGARASALAVNLCDTEGRTALAWACARHNEGCVRQLLACQKIEAGLVDVLGRSAADLAHGHRAILSQLRERGVVPTSTVK